MIVREITGNDIERVVSLLNSLTDSYPDDKKEALHTKESICSELERPKEFRPVYLVVEENKKIVGAASISFISGTCLIKELTVEKSEKKKGYGSALIKEIEKRAASNGCGKVWAYSAVLYNAKGFYEKNGYAEEGLLKNHFYGLDHYIFGKVL